MSPNPTRKDIIQAIITNPTLNEEQKSLLVEEFIEEIKKESPELKNHATKSDVVNTELKLTKEIEQVKLEIEQVRLELTKEIEQVRLELTKEIENIRKEIKELDVKLAKEIEHLREFKTDVNRQFDETLKRLDRFMFWSLGLVMASTAIIIKVLGT